jgi:hypothetical protein
MAQVMKATQAFFDNSRVMLIMCLWLALYAGAHLWPASWWFEVRKVQVLDAQANSEITMLVDREIHRQFVGEWVSTVRRVEPKSLELYCSGSGRANYRPSNDLPDVVTLDWWTGGSCKTLPSGDYVIDTTWQINPAIAFLPEKHIRNTSNIFHVCGNPNCPRAQTEVTP